MGFTHIVGQGPPFTPPGRSGGGRGRRVCRVGRGRYALSGESADAKGVGPGVGAGCGSLGRAGGGRGRAVLVHRMGGGRGRGGRGRAVSMPDCEGRGVGL